MSRNMFSGQVFLLFGEKKKKEELMIVSGENQYRGCRLSDGRRDWELKVEETRIMTRERDLSTIFLLFEFRPGDQRSERFA